MSNMTNIYLVLVRTKNGSIPLTHNRMCASNLVTPSIDTYIYGDHNNNFFRVTPRVGEVEHLVDIALPIGWGYAIEADSKEVKNLPDWRMNLYGVAREKLQLAPPIPTKNVGSKIMQGVTPGRIIHYVLHKGMAFSGEHRPAIIIRVWDSPEYINNECNLSVFTDHKNDGGEGGIGNGLMWATSVPFSNEKEPGTWHWVERV